MNFFSPVTNALKNLGGEEVVLKVLDHFAEMGEIRQCFSDPLSVLQSAAKAYLASHLPQALIDVLDLGLLAAGDIGRDAGFAVLRLFRRFFHFS